MMLVATIMRADEPPKANQVRVRDKGACYLRAARKMFRRPAGLHVILPTDLNLAAGITVYRGSRPIGNFLINAERGEAR